MTAPSSMERIFSELWKKTRLAKDYEWTMEANPSSVDLDRMRAYRSLGINRVSMGVQSLRNDHLKNLGRVHDRGEALKSLDILFKSGFENVSVDLLCGVPGQTLQDLKAALDELTSHPIQHLSCYILTLGTKHKMFKDLPDEDTQLEHYLYLDEYMTSHGFEHYEISNFAKPGRRARHNLVYWKNEPYLSFGPSAHSFNSEQGVRFKNYSSLHQYAEKIEKGEFPIEWKEDLTQEQKNIEAWMLAVRLEEGFPKDWIKTPHQQAVLGRFLTGKLIQSHPKVSDRYQLTPRGLALSEQIVKELI